MNKIILTVLAVLAVIAGLALAYYGFVNFPAGKAPQQAPAQTNILPPSGQNQALPGGPRAVDISNFSFQPDSLTVAPGTTVVWTNNDSAPHQIKSDTFNSASLSKGQSFSFTFATAGTFDYSCAIHPSMKGRIIVQ